MAKKVLVEYVDDIDGTPLDADGKTITFAVDGVEYSIDLHSENARAFHRALDHYIEHATRLSSRRETPGVVLSRSQARTRSQAIRQWAATNGHSVPARGRIPGAIEQAYIAAQ
ncbi:Lsr2 family protein [Rhodococcus spelaei]|uniref:Lsr2 family protein n=1 Tax=Rhodococcus spelaei TaxID=2546320 RepID=A0A541BP69_9NOCA|nr:Lsr2 family protein [Rhodococcus spelaei]TQF74119.1 Lsr2 family protein [Rhodococcus spelaei]